MISNDTSWSLFLKFPCKKSYYETNFSPEAAIIHVLSEENYTVWYWSWWIASRSTSWCQQPSLIKCWKHTMEWNNPITTILWILKINWLYERHINMHDYAVWCLRERSSLHAHISKSLKCINKWLHLFWPSCIICIIVRPTTKSQYKHSVIDLKCFYVQHLWIKMSFDYLKSIKYFNGIYFIIVLWCLPSTAYVWKTLN